MLKRSVFWEDLAGRVLGERVSIARSPNSWPAFWMLSNGSIFTVLKNNNNKTQHYPLKIFSFVLYFSVLLFSSHFRGF